MTNMESVVRPFGAQSIAPAPLGLGSTNYVPPGIIQVSFGGAGGRTASWTVDGSGSILRNTDSDFKESSRKSDNRRVENPDDADQFVEFCQARSISLNPTRQGGTNGQRQSTYDLSGGYHDLTGGAAASPQRNGNVSYGFNNKPTRVCDNGSPPQRGCN